METTTYQTAFVPAWPGEILAHQDVPSVFTYGTKIEWREPRVIEGDQEVWSHSSPFRTCSYCGSIHPGDLHHLITHSRRLGSLDDRVTLGGSDWKYGWPHKFYVSGIPNPLFGKVVKMGSKSGPVFGDPDNPKRITGRTDEPIMAEASKYTHAKWYNVHIKDIVDERTREVFCNMLEVHGGIRFRLEEGKLRYGAPYAGFQA